MVVVVGKTNGLNVWCLLPSNAAGFDLRLRLQTSSLLQLGMSLRKRGGVGLGWGLLCMHARCLFICRISIP